MCVEWGSTNTAGTSMFMMIKISTHKSVKVKKKMGNRDGAFMRGIYDLNGWGIYGLKGWGIYDLNGWGI